MLSPARMFERLGDVTRRWQVVTTVAFIILLAIFFFSASLAYRSVSDLRATHDVYVASSKRVEAIDELLQYLTDAETGQRGFLLTGKLEYLDIYNASISHVNEEMAIVKAGLSGGGRSSEYVDKLQDDIEIKLKELAYTIQLERAGSHPAALAVVQNDGGKTAMDDVRRYAADLVREEDQNRIAVADWRQRLTDSAKRSLVFASILVLAFLGASFALILRALESARQDRETRERRAEELESAVQARTVDLTKAIKELEGFTYSVSHDMRTPLRWIVGSSQILLEDHRGQFDGEAEKLLLRQVTAGNKLSKLIDDLLTYARLARKPIEKTEVDLMLPVRELLAEQPEVQLDAPPKIVAKGDGSMLDSVMRNLIENSLKYRSTDRPLHLTVGRRHTDKGNAIFVEDNGIGFDQAYVAKIFMPFERLHRDTEYSGTGIGLANVQRIIERHGGQLWAEGKLGEGATFFFTLP